uniref:Uncharacterized protein n=1 Tax=Rhizophora mucronata TaxID=61149 RepID=A0A2P2JBG1_RHIMU
MVFTSIVQQDSLLSSKFK